MLLTEVVAGLAAATEENMCLCLEEILGIFRTPSLSLSHSKGTKREAILQEGQLRYNLPLDEADSGAHSPFSFLD